MKHYIFFILFSLMSAIGFSQQLVYKPLNPAFGGEVFNYNWLLSSAQAQNAFSEDPKEKGENSQNEFDRLRNSIDTQFLNQLTRNAFGDTFGSDGLQPGTYSYGNLNINVTPSTEGLAVRIIDINTGEVTTIIIPYY